MNVAKIFLSFSQEIAIIPIIILGLIWLNFRIFYHATCLFLLGMLYSFALKNSFQISSPLHGFVFPSGHMLSSTILYGQLAYKFNNLFFRILILILLGGIGASLVYSNYHNYYDVLGGVFFAIMLIGIYNFVQARTPGFLLALCLAFASLIIIYSYIGTNQIMPHLFLAYYALIGFTLSTRIFAKKTELENISGKVLATIFCFLSIFIIRYIFNLISLPIYLHQLQWLLVGISIPASCLSANIILAKTSSP